MTALRLDLTIATYPDALVAAVALTAYVVKKLDAAETRLTEVTHQPMRGEP